MKLNYLKYAVPTFYDLYKTGGSTLKDEKRGLGEGNYLYRGFDEVYKEYRVQTILKMERGKLQKILRTIQREQLKKMMEKEDNGQTAGTEI